MESVLGTWRHASADLLLGTWCPGCRRPGYGLCSRCHQAIASATRWEYRDFDNWPLVAAAGPYHGVLREVLTAHKEHHERRLTTPLADLLVTAVAMVLHEAGGTAVTLTPMPSTARSIRQRGYDSVALLAQRAGTTLRRVGVTVRVRTVLHHSRAVGDQAALSFEQRRLNLAGALWAEPVPDPVIIVDDIVTTGASVAEASRALAAAQVEVMGAAVVGATQLRNAQSGHPRQPRWL